MQIEDKISTTERFLFIPSTSFPHVNELSSLVFYHFSVTFSSPHCGIFESRTLLMHYRNFLAVLKNDKMGAKEAVGGTLLVTQIEIDLHFQRYK